MSVQGYPPRPAARPVGSGERVPGSRRPDHLVQFYEQADSLVPAVERYLGKWLAEGDAAIVVATPEHRDALARRLAAGGLDLAEIRASSRYVELDAAEMLARFLRDGRPVAPLFREAMEESIGRARGETPRALRIFGEMVALLWAEGNERGAVALERLWNDLARRQPFSLFCAYPIQGFASANGGRSFHAVCAEHSAVLAEEPRRAEADERGRSLAELQRKAWSLEVEIARRRKVERALRRRERELAISDRRKDEFLAMLGHELRNPLSPIVAALERLRLGKHDPETVARSVEILDRQTQHLRRLVDDLLDLSRINHGKIALRREELPLAEVVAQAVEQARAAIEEKAHRLDVDIPADPVWLVADRERLTQILTNLLINAARYTAPNGEIRIEARAESGTLVLRVRDNGMGLPSGIGNRIFDLFAQNAEGAPASREGLGVGLALVRRLVELHGGSVEGESPGPGRGSVFTVRLPLGPPRRRERKRRHEPAVAARRARRILVADDNVDGADALGDLLRVLGHDVSVVYGGPAAIEEALRSRPEIVFLDIAMPGMNGHEVARRLRGIGSLAGTVLVALTGYGQEVDTRRSRHAGFDHHLVKPVDVLRLERLLENPAGAP